MTCPYCASTMTTGRSKTTQLGYRTFFCRDCRRTFNERTGTPLAVLLQVSGQLEALVAKGATTSCNPLQPGYIACANCGQATASRHILGT